MPGDGAAGRIHDNGAWDEVLGWNGLDQCEYESECSDQPVQDRHCVEASPIAKLTLLTRWRSIRRAIALGGAYKIAPCSPLALPECNRLCCSPNLFFSAHVKVDLAPVCIRASQVAEGHRGFHYIVSPKQALIIPQGPQSTACIRG